MSRSHFALFVALLVHTLLLLLFWILGTFASEIKTYEKKEQKKIKVSLKEMPPKHKDSGEKKIIEKNPPPLAPSMPKGSQLKEVEQIPKKRELIEFKPKKEQSSKKISADKTKKEPVQSAESRKTEPIPPVKTYIPLDIPALAPKIPVPAAPKERKKESLEWLYEDRTDKDEKDQKRLQTGSSIGNQNLKELYGDEFGELTPGQQKYLLDNQEIMRRITQEVLNRVAQVNLSRELDVNRMNIVEFYLHPNGDISDFRFIKKSGYYILDDTTKETIEYAYSKYPRPQEKILVRYNVFYNLARYQ